MAAFLNTYFDKMDRIASAVSECRRMGLEVLRPDVNHSCAHFTIEAHGEGRAIRFGMASIKNVGGNAVQPIAEARGGGGEFKSIEDFCRRVELRNVNKKVMESLIKAGAFDSLGRRGALLAALDRIVALSQREQKQRLSGQSSMFDLFGQNVDVPLPALDLEDFDVTLQEKLSWEKELMGIYFSEHPLTAMASRLAEHATVLCGEINNEMAGEKVIVAGMVTAVRHVTTRNNRLFVIATFEDLNGSIEVTVWSDVYTQTQELWVDGSILLLEGYVRVREDRANVNCTKVSRYEPEPAGSEPPKAEPVKPDNGKKNNHVKPRTLIINIRQSDDSQKDLEHLQKVMGVLRRHPGNDSVQLAIRKGEEITRMEVPDIKVDYSDELLGELTPQISS